MGFQCLQLCLGAFGWWYSALCTLHVSVSNALAVALCVGLSELLGRKTPVHRIGEESRYQLNEFRVVLCVLPCACFGFLRIVRGTKQAPKREKTPVRRMCCLPAGGATQVVGAHRHTGRLRMGCFSPDVASYRSRGRDRLHQG